MGEPTREEVERLLCAVFPTWYERALNAVVSWCYARDDVRVLDWIGGRADSVRARSTKRRARRKAMNHSGGQP